MKTVLIVGASGLVGSELVKQFVKLETCQKVIVLSRRDLQFKHSKIENHIINFDELGSLELHDSIDACFCCLGTTQKKMGQEGMLKVDYHYVIELGKLCSRSKIDKFLVVSSNMANHKSASFYMRTKGQMEIAVGKLPIPIIYFVRPSLLVGERDENRWAEKAGYYLYTALSPIMLGSLRKMRAIKGEQVAHAMIVLANRNDEGIFTVESDELAAL